MGFLELPRSVSSRQAAKVCRMIGAKGYYECSAVTLEGVQEVFETATQAVSYFRARHSH
jgi:hypothetical protein